MAVKEFVKGKFYESQDDPPKILLCVGVEEGEDAEVHLQFEDGAVWPGPVSHAQDYFTETDKTWNDEEKK